MVDTPFVIDPAAGQTVGYRQLAEAVLAPRVPHRAWCRPSRPAECFLALASAFAAGRDLTLVDADFTERELAELGFAAATPGAEALVASAHPATNLGEWLGWVRASCRSRVTLFTSGSTGLPKAVSHALPNLCRVLRVDPKHAGDVWGFAYNPTHIAGVQVFLQALFNQNPLVNLFRSPPAEVLDLIEAQGITHLSATPTFYRLLLPAGRPLTGVRSVTLGGERTDARLIGRLRPLFPQARFRNLYASTEAGTLLSSDGDTFSIPPGFTDRIQLREGRLHVHGSFLGEFRTPAGPGAEWYDTGDVVDVVSEAPLRFRIVSRDRDWVNVGGNKVNPAEVEEVLQGHPQVREARVFGRANPVLGKVLCAEVVAAFPPPTEAALRQFLAAQVQPFKVPRLIRLVERIEQTRTGKTRRDEH